MNDDLIRRQAAIDALHQYFADGFEEDRWWNSTHVLAAIKAVPTAEPTTCKYWDTESDFCALYRPSAQSRTNEEAFEEGYTKAQMELKDAYKPKKGEWIPVVDGHCITWECSECHVESEAWTDYCPICGSRNIEEMDDDVTYEEALEEFRKNPKTYTLNEVEAELGLTAEPEYEGKGFLEFLWNVINPNEMENYLAMYNSKGVAEDG